ncbi:hypothetical protein Tco_0738942 [Tanacetum coccineum]
MAYKLELPVELSNVQNTFHVSNLKKCLSDESLIIPMKELQLDDKLNFVEEPVEIMDREIKDSEFLCSPPMISKSSTKMMDGDHLLASLKFLTILTAPPASVATSLAEKRKMPFWLHGP